MNNLSNHEITILIAATIFHTRMNSQVGQTTYRDDASQLIGKLIDRLPESDRNDWIEHAKEHNIELAAVV